MNWIWFLFSFKGRINRKPFFMYQISLVLLWTFYCLLLHADFFMKDEKSIPFVLITSWPTFAVQAKRWHDRDKSGWWLLINFIPLVGAIWSLIETCFIEGTRGENRFGKDPLKRIDEVVKWVVKPKNVSITDRPMNAPSAGENQDDRGKSI